jgi:hypothetical protein
MMTMFEFLAGIVFGVGIAAIINTLRETEFLFWLGEYLLEATSLLIDFYDGETTIYGKLIFALLSVLFFIVAFLVSIACVLTHIDSFSTSFINRLSKKRT